MKNLHDFLKKLNNVTIFLWTKLVWFHHTLLGLISSILHIPMFQVNPFYIQLGYFLTLSSLGFLALKASNPRNNINPKNLDLFFTSVSAATVSSMSTVEMEVFSNTQLIFLTFLMFFGGEVFTSILELHFKKAKMVKIGSCINESADHVELGFTTRIKQEKPDFEKLELTEENTKSNDDQKRVLRIKSIKILAILVSCYLVLVHLLGTILIFIYFKLIPSAARILNQKGLKTYTFSVFTMVSTFSNCGFVPTNENMMIFKKYSGLLIILIPQILMGNTLFAVCLRLTIGFLSKVTKREEFNYILNYRELRYEHLLSGIHTFYVGITAFVFIVVQLIVFGSLDWDSEVTEGLNAYQKMVGILFQVVNSRHAGESVFDLATISPAVLALFVIMMYLPPYTRFVPIHEEDGTVSIVRGDRKRRRGHFMEHMLFSRISYLSIFIILICITERENIRKDPINFSVFNILVEVISASGNVGFSTGYSCGRQVSPNHDCRDASYGFAGRWSPQGKFVLILVMLTGRLKKFNMRGGRAWSLS